MNILRRRAIVIDLESGKVFHQWLGNESYPERLFIDKGSLHLLMKIITISRAGQRGDVEFKNMTVIHVETFAEGVKKPFVAIESSAIASGYCE